MSIWYKVKEQEDVELSVDGKTLDVCFLEDHNGGNYVEIPIEFVKKAMPDHIVGSAKMAKLKAEFETVVPKMLNEGIVDIGDRYKTELIVGGKVIEKLWQWFENIILELKAENERLVNANIDLKKAAYDIAVQYKDKIEMLEATIRANDILHTEEIEELLISNSEDDKHIRFETIDECIADIEDEDDEELQELVRSIKFNLEKLKVSNGKT